MVQYCIKFVLQLHEEIMSRAVDALMATYKPVVEDHHFGCWTITATKCHILASEGPERETCVFLHHILSHSFGSKISQ